MTTMTRIYNFAAGPAILPLPVLEEAQRDLVSLPGLACRSWRSAIDRQPLRIFFKAP